MALALAMGMGMGMGERGAAPERARVDAGALLAFLKGPEAAARLSSHVAAECPREACALVFEAQPGQLTLELVDNLADTLHRADPKTFPRTAESAFVIDVRIIARVEATGGKLVAIVHSHPRGPTAMSDQDRRLAMTPDGSRPLFPDVYQVIVEPTDQGALAIEVHAWCEALGAYVGGEVARAEIVR